MLAQSKQARCQGEDQVFNVVEGAVSSSSDVNRREEAEDIIRGIWELPEATPIRVVGGDVVRLREFEDALFEDKLGVGITHSRKLGTRWPSCSSTSCRRTDGIQMIQWLFPEQVHEYLSGGRKQGRGCGVRDASLSGDMYSTLKLMQAWMYLFCPSPCNFVVMGGWQEL